MRQPLVSFALALTFALSSIAPIAGAGTRVGVVYDLPALGPGGGAGIVFADALQQATGWTSSTQGALKLDAAGNVRALMPGQSAARTVYATESYPAGDYTLLYDGTGNFEVSGGTIVAASPGRATVRVPANDGSGLSLRLTATDESNPARNVRLILPGFEATYATQPFVPAFVRSLLSKEALGFAQWMHADTFVDSNFWIQRPRVGRATQVVPNGVAPEYMILLANLTGAAPWFTLPAGASDAYAYNFAALVHRTLDPRLHPVFQYGNAMWNDATPGNAYARMAARNVGIGGDPATGALAWYARRSSRLFTLIRSAYGPDAPKALRAISGPLPGSSATAVALDEFLLQAAGGGIDAFAVPVSSSSDLAGVARLALPLRVQAYAHTSLPAAVAVASAPALQPLANARLVMGTDRPGSYERHGPRTPLVVSSALHPLSAPAVLDLGGRPGVSGALGVSLAGADPAAEGSVDWVKVRESAVVARKATAEPQIRVAPLAGGAFALSVPADARERVLRVYVGVDRARGALSATLDGSTYSDASLASATGTREGVYTLVYRAATPGRQLTVRFAPQTQSGGSVALRAATVNTFPLPTRPPSDEPLYHNDLLRTGWNANETTLTPANVASGLGLRQTLAVDGDVLAQPLYLAQYTISGAPHNVLIVATENASVYEFDADSGAVLNHVSLGTSQNSNDVGCADIRPTYGITSTPVIDRSSGTLYVVAATEPTTGQFHTTVHALDIGTLTDKVTPVEIAATANLNNGSKLTFKPQFQYSRAGLVWANNSLYVSIGSHCDNDAGAISGWVLRYNSSLSQIGKFATIGDPTGDCNTALLSSVWMSGFAPSVDAGGNLYFATGNGSFTANAGGRDYGESVLKLKPDVSHVLSYFTPADYNSLNCGDGDLGSGGAMLVPNNPTTSAPFVVAMGKESTIFLLNSAALGGESSTNAGAIQVVPDSGGGVWGGPAYYNGPTGPFVYYQTGGDTLHAYKVSYGATGRPGPNVTPNASAPLAQLTLSSSGNSYSGYGGSTPIVSSNGQMPHTAIVWLVQRGSGTIYLEAYDALNVSTRLFQGNAGTWSNPQNNAFVTPLVANGKVYVPGTNAVTVFGL